MGGPVERGTQNLHMKAQLNLSSQVTRSSLLSSLQRNFFNSFFPNFASCFSKILLSSKSMGMALVLHSPSHSERSVITIERSHKALAWANAQRTSDLQKAARRGGKGETRECHAIYSGVSFISGEESQAPQSIRSQGWRTDLEIDKTETRWLC